jgi:hypothetical protein
VIVLLGCRTSVEPKLDEAFSKVRTPPSGPWLVTASGAWSGDSLRVTFTLDEDPGEMNVDYYFHVWLDTDNSTATGEPGYSHGWDRGCFSAQAARLKLPVDSLCSLEDLPVMGTGSLRGVGSLTLELSLPAASLGYADGSQMPCDVEVTNTVNGVGNAKLFTIAPRPDFTAKR